MLVDLEHDLGKLQEISEVIIVGSQDCFSDLADFEFGPPSIFVEECGQAEVEDLVPQLLHILRSVSGLEEHGQCMEGIYHLLKGHLVDGR